MINLDLTNVDAMTDKPKREPVPAGTYKAICTDFEIREYPWGMGGKVSFRITEGPFEGRYVNDFMTLIHHEKPMGQRIGQAKLKSWCIAIGIEPVVSSTAPLVNQLVGIKVSVDKGSEQYGPQNRVQNFVAPDAVDNAAAPAAVSPAAKEAAPSQPDGGAAMPWNRG